MSETQFFVETLMVKLDNFINGIAEHGLQFNYFFGHYFSVCITIRRRFQLSHLKNWEKNWKKRWIFFFFFKLLTGQVYSGEFAQVVTNDEIDVSLVTGYPTIYLKVINCIRKFQWNIATILHTLQNFTFAKTGFYSLMLLYTVHFLNVTKEDPKW